MFFFKPKKFRFSKRNLQVLKYCLKLFKFLHKGQFKSKINNNYMNKLALVIQIKKMAWIFEKSH